MQLRTFSLSSLFVLALVSVAQAHPSHDPHVHDEGSVAAGMHWLADAVANPVTWVIAVAMVAAAGFGWSRLRRRGTTRVGNAASRGAK